MSDTTTTLVEQANEAINAAHRAVQRAVASLSLTSAPDDVKAVRCMVDFYQAQGKAADDQCDAFMFEYIPERGEIEINGKKYYVGPTKKESCIDVAKAVDAIFTVAGGDVKAVTDCISKNGLKPGACKKVLGDAWGEHFTVTTSDTLHVQKIDTEFMDRKREANARAANAESSGK